MLQRESTPGEHDGKLPRSLDDGEGRSQPLHDVAFDLHASPLSARERGTALLTPAWRDHLMFTGLGLVSGLGLGPLPLPPRELPTSGMIVGRELTRQ